MEGFDFEVLVVRGSLESHEAVEEQDLKTSKIGQFRAFCNHSHKKIYTLFEVNGLAQSLQGNCSLNFLL